MKKRNIFYLLVFFYISFFIVGCSQEVPAPDSDSDQDQEPLTAMYVGSDTCKSCHSETHEGFIQTGHFNAFKPLTEYDIIDFPEQIKIFDMEDQENSVSTTLDLASASGVMVDHYVIAQVSSDAGFKNDYYRVASLEKEGDKWKIQPVRTGDFDNDGAEDWGAASYSCQTCHSPNLGKIEDEATISCESCHGPGGNHIKAENKEGTMTVSQEVCYTCHNSNPNKNDEGIWEANNHYGTRNYFASKHAQSEATNDCLTCHTPHAVNKDGKTVIGDDPTTNCQTCHTQDMNLEELMWMNPTDEYNHFTKDHSFGAMPYEKLGDKEDTEAIEITNSEMIEIIENNLPEQDENE